MNISDEAVRIVRPLMMKWYSIQTVMSVCVYSCRRRVYWGEKADGRRKVMLNVISPRSFRISSVTNRDKADLLRYQYTKKALKGNWAENETRERSVGCAGMRALYIGGLWKCDSKKMLCRNAHLPHEKQQRFLCGMYTLQKIQ